MPGLLAAERPPPGAQLLEDVAVADLRDRDLDPRLAHRRVEAVVRHHRDRDATPEPAGGAQVQRRQRDELVAVDDLPGAVDGEHAVAVPVESEADVVLTVAHARDERLEVRRPAAVVDVAAVRLVADDVHVRAEAAEDLRRHAIGGPVRAVEQDTAPLQVERLEARVQRAEIVLLRAVQRADAADPVRRRGDVVVEACLDRGLRVVGELEAVRREELDAVVGERIVRRADDRGEIEPVAAHEQRRRRRGQHAAEQDLGPRARRARGQCGLEHLTGFAGVPDDEHPRVLGGGLQRRRATESHRQVGGEQVAGDATDAVGAEQLAGHPRECDASAG